MASQRSGGANGEPISIPAEAVVEVFSEPTPELLQHRLEALTSLLRVALLAGMEFTLPTALHLLLDVCPKVVPSDRHLLLFERPREPASRLRLTRHFDPPPVAEIETNLLHAWVGRAGKPVLAFPGLAPAMDHFLQQLGAHAALAAPLYLEHDFAGSIQLFRVQSPAFDEPDARLLWILSLLAENQLTRLNLVQHLIHVAYTDYLTGLRARGYFEQVLEQEVRRSLRREAYCGLLLLDVDDFKSVNDRFGHHAGDAVLRQLAEILTHDMRDVDTVARYGGDEFAIILPETDHEGARFVATRIRDAARHHHFALPDSGGTVDLSLSIGIALCPDDESSAGQLLRAADLALYQAKLLGKDRPFFTRELRQQRG